MIKSVALANFKCFSDSTIETRSLTLLTGYNSAGKSSFIQALLLVAAAYRETSRHSNHLPLDSVYGLAPGRAADLLHAGLGTHDISIALTDDTSTARCKLSADPTEDLVLIISQCAIDSRLPWDRLWYVGAERLGPQEVGDLRSAPRAELEVGMQGEYTAQVLAARERHPIRGALYHPNTEQEAAGSSLLKQTELWMGEFVADIEIRPTYFDDATLASLRYKKRGIATEWLRPVHAGFGVSYVLPIVVSALLTEVGDVLLVENPEAHLHPAAQSRMGRFLAAVVASGVQVIVETHSDHVLNGVRLAVASAVPSHEHVIVQYFTAEMAGKPTAITVNANGGLSSWPRGFFDQSERDLAEIVRGRRP